MRERAQGVGWMALLLAGLALIGGLGGFSGFRYGVSQQNELAYSNPEQDNRQNDSKVVDYITFDLQKREFPNGYHLLGWLVYVVSCYLGGVACGVVGFDRVSSRRLSGCTYVACGIVLIIAGAISSIFGPPWLWWM